MSGEFRNSFAERVKDLSWLAGFFDGEGCIYFKESRIRTTIKNVAYYSPDIQVILAQSDDNGKLLMESLQEVYGFGKITSKHGSSFTKKIPYMTRLSGKKAVDFLKLIEPFLLLKKERAKQVISFGESFFYGK